MLCPHFPTIRVACVPEQVNIPLKMTVANHLDAKYNINIEIISVPEGTGKMLSMLENNETDIAMTVSDAFIVAKGQNREVTLSGVWVSSPLVWAVASSPSLPTNITTVRDLYRHRQIVTGNTSAKLRVGVSRLGSGSHTMAYYLAMITNLRSDGVSSELGTEAIGSLQECLEFVVANNFENLKKGIEEDKFDIFMWETFTTKPDFDSNRLRKLGDIQTPWPAFSFVTSTHLSLEREQLIQNSLFPALAEGVQLFLSDKDRAVSDIVSSFGHRADDAKEWLGRVQYSCTQQWVPGKDLATPMTIDPSVFQKSVEILKAVNLLPPTFETHYLWDQSFSCHSTSLDSSSICSLRSSDCASDTAESSAPTSAVSLSSAVMNRILLTL